MKHVLVFLLLLTACVQTTNLGPGGVPIEGDAQIVMLGMDGKGYLPREITVEANKPVTLKNDGTLGGCGVFIVQNELGINADFSRSDEYTFTPTKKGTFTYSCSMDMYRGIIKII